MRNKFVIFLLLLNISVVGAGYYYASRYWNTQLAAEHETSVTEVTKWQAKAAAARASATAVILRTNTFNWSQIESADYRQYIANLRAIGCPEITLRDIILTDVMRLYAARRGAFYSNGRPFRYWETNEKRKLKQNQIEDREKQLALIDKELPAVLRELLGINYERELDKYFVDADEDNHRLAFLSDDKRDRILALRDQFEGRRERVMARVQDGQITPAQAESLKQIDADQQAALEALLTPGEKEEYEMTESPTAERLRERLIGFNPTEAEFRQIFASEAALDAAYAYQNTNDPAVQAAKAADQAKLDEQIKSTLGPDRAIEFAQAQNPDYQNIVTLADRFDLPANTPQTLLDMRQTAESEKQQLLDNQNIDPARRDAALKDIEAETERTVRGVIGDKATAEYLENGGVWIKGLGAN